MKRWLLDTSALLALRDDEAGGDAVADLLTQAQAGKARYFGCFITLMEVLYRVWKDERRSCRSPCPRAMPRPAHRVAARNPGNARNRRAPESYPAAIVGRRLDRGGGRTESRHPGEQRPGILRSASAAAAVAVQVVGCLDKSVLAGRRLVEQELVRTLGDWANDRGGNGNQPFKGNTYFYPTADGVSEQLLTGHPARMNNFSLGATLNIRLTN